MSGVLKKKQVSLSLENVRCLESEHDFSLSLSPSLSHLKMPGVLKEKNMCSFSQFLHKQQNRLLGHIVRADCSDPLRQSTLNQNSIYPYDPGKKRVGRPKNNWCWKTYERLALKNTPATATTFKQDPYFYLDLMEHRIRNREIAAREE